jgi:hypothetical protein
MVTLEFSSLLDEPCRPLLVWASEGLEVRVFSQVVGWG